jgi:hypothetical protein
LTSVALDPSEGTAGRFVDRALAAARRGAGWTRATWTSLGLGVIRPIGVVLLALGLVSPWLVTSLEPQRDAFGVAVVLPGMPHAGWVSYGAAITVCLVVACIGLIGSRRWGRVVTSGAGWVAAGLVLLFPVATAIGNSGLVQHLSDRTSDLSYITAQFGYKVPGNPIVNVGPMALTGPWRVITTGLRLGWVLCLVGAAMLAFSGVRELGPSLRKKPLVVVAAIVIGIGVGATLGRGLQANRLEVKAVNETHVGNYTAALRDMQRAVQWNGAITSRAPVALAYGDILQRTGHIGTAYAHLSHAAFLALAGDENGRLTDLQIAHRLDPANAVVSNALQRLLRDRARSNLDPGLLASALNDPHLDGTAAEYTLGRLYYTVGRYPEAIARLERVRSETTNHDVRSSADTYIALSLQKLAQPIEARRVLLRAIAEDRGYFNSLARSLATGLYLSAKP